MAKNDGICADCLKRWPERKIETTTRKKEPHYNELIVCLRVHCVVEYIEKQ